jgi:hypothetical protein
VKLLFEAAAARHEREHNERAWLAWHTAAFHRTKKMPQLRDIQTKHTARKRQSWREQWEVMAEWAHRRSIAKARMEQLNGR